MTERSGRVRKVSLYFGALLSVFLGFVLGQILLFCLIIAYVMHELSLQVLIVVSPLITIGFYLLFGGLRFLKLIRGGKVVVTDYYPPDVFLPKRGCKIIERRKLRFLGLLNAKEYYLAECTVCGHLLRMAVIADVSLAGYPTIIYLGNVHVIFEGYNLFERLELT